MMVDNEPTQVSSSNLNLSPLLLPTPPSSSFSSSFPSSSSSSWVPPPFPPSPASLFLLPPSFSSSASSSLDSSSNTHYVYVLALEHDRYYVGRASSLPNLYQRWTQHWQGVATPFTSIFKPLAVVDMKETMDPFLEETTTLNYMMKYSIPQVRGGSMTSLQFTKEEEINLQLRLRSIQNVCYLCGEKGHFQATCSLQEKSKLHSLTQKSKKPHSSNNKQFHPHTNRDLFKDRVDTKSEEDDEEEDETTIEIEVPSNCLRCGRYGHTKQQCQFKRDHQGQWLDIT